MTMLLLLSVLLATDAGLTREEAQGIARAAMVDMAADAIQADPQARAVVLNAARCAAMESVDASAKRLRLRWDRLTLRAWLAAGHDVERIEFRIAVNQALGILRVARYPFASGMPDVEPRACSAWNVAPLAECLRQAPGDPCAADQRVQAQMTAASRMIP